MPAQPQRDLAAGLLQRRRRRLQVEVAFSLTADGAGGDALLADLRQILDDLQIAGQVRIRVD